MVLSVSGTTVIDNSRNLANIANLKTIDGNAILGAGNITSSDVTLLGTLTTSSGSSQQLSGLTLTSYSQLLLSFNNVSHNDTVTSRTFLLGQSTADDKDVTSAVAATATVRGIIHISLNAGIFISYVDAGSVTTVVRGTLPITRSSTTISIAVAGVGNAFDGGDIKVYGILGNL